MPPKISQIEKELKKKNKETAENLVKMLEQNSEDVVSTVNSSGTNAVRAGSARVTRRIENPLKGAKHAATSLSKATAFEKDRPDSKRSAEKEKSVSKRSTQKDKPESKRSTEKNKPALKRPLDKFDVSSSKKSKNEEQSDVRNQITKENSAGARNLKAAKIFRYEIDCTRVKDSVDVKDLQQYVRVQLKVNGEKNNLEGNLTVSVEGHKVVINSKVYLPKRSLRFLSKKFLKKSWNIQVISQNKNSYEFKYIGTQ